MSNYDSYRGIFGHECINEWIVAKLLDILEIPHLEYPLIFARLCVDGREMEGYVTKSFNFRKTCYHDRESIRKFDVMKERTVNNFIGSKSLEYNLKLIPRGKKFFQGELKAEHKEWLLNGLEEALSEEHLEKIWEMIWERWKKYVEICD